MSAINLTDEARLAPDITYQPYQAAELKQVFLTGASGFLGAFLLAELLTKTTAQVHCLVRADDNSHAHQRVIATLQNYQLWQTAWRDRVVAWAGDLALPQLGLQAKTWQQLCCDIDVIYHNGAIIHNFLPYTRLKAANVTGTETILRLASTDKTKPVHFISSMAVFFSQHYLQQASLDEQAIPLDDGTLKGGYKQSKWVAEALIREAQKRGLPASIYRPVRILGHSQTGVNGNLKDSLCQLIKGSIYLNQFPQLDIRINLVPVDFVASAIVGLSQHPQALGRGFNLYNPKATPWADFQQDLQALGAEFDFKLETLDFKAWLAVLQAKIEAGDKTQVYTFLRLFFRSPNNLLMKKPDLNSPEMWQLLAELGIQCPAVNQQLWQHYLNYFYQSDYMT